jgi:hypothetical protein
LYPIRYIGLISIFGDFEAHIIKMCALKRQPQSGYYKKNANFSGENMPRGYELKSLQRYVFFSRNMQYMRVNLSKKALTLHSQYSAAQT